MSPELLLGNTCVDERLQSGFGSMGTGTIKPWISIPLFSAESSSLYLRGKMRCGAGSLAGSQVCPGWVDCVTLPHPPQSLKFSRISLSLNWGISWKNLRVLPPLAHLHPTHINSATLGHAVLRRPEIQHARSIIACVHWCLLWNRAQLNCSAPHIPYMHPSHRVSQWNHCSTPVTCCFVYSARCERMQRDPWPLLAVS